MARGRVVWSPSTAVLLALSVLLATHDAEHWRDVDRDTQAVPGPDLVHEILSAGICLANLIVVVLVITVFLYP